jgi:hypothetical protein
MENTLNCSLNYSTAGELGYQTGDTNSAVWHPYDWDYHWHWYPQSYPVYIEKEGKVSQAFKIVSKMLEKKIIEKELTIKDFIELVNTIADIL